jgi:pyruvate/2-oxoglutarate dehydrogenase complex dihydrolipoamide acyltransferase (E2) component
MTSHVVVVPDLKLDRGSLAVSLWLAKKGDAVVEGDRLVELLAGDVLVDLAAPATGVFAKKYVGEDQEVQPGQRLAIIESDDDRDD